MSSGSSVVTNESLRSMLRCPVTQSALSPADEALIEQANQMQASEKLLDQIGQPVVGPIEAGLVNANQSLLIPVQGGIVILLADRLIPLGQLNSRSMEGGSR